MKRQNSSLSVESGISSSCSDSVCLAIVWSQSVRYERAENDVYSIDLQKFTLDSTSKKVRASLVKIATFCNDEIVYDDQVHIIDAKSAQLRTQFHIPEGVEIDKSCRSNIAGMSMLFGQGISSAENSGSLLAQFAQSDIDALPDEHREFVNSEIQLFLEEHGYKNVTKRLAIETGDASIAISKNFAPRPKPTVSDTPRMLENVQVNDIIYPRRQVILLPADGKRLTVNISGNNTVLLDQLHTAGKNGDVLQCEILEVIGAQNKLEYELLSAALQPQAVSM